LAGVACRIGQQGDRRIIFVISGLDTAQARAEEAEAIVNWAFRQFVKRPVASADTRIAEAEVWMGAVPRVGLTPAEDLEVLMPVLAGDMLEAEVVYNGPVTAPVQKGQQLAELVIPRADLPDTRVPLVAAEDVPRGGFMVRVLTAAKVLARQVQERSAAPPAEGTS
jgi:D-alanyl-D-alanine carboxypeptidase